MSQGHGFSGGHGFSWPDLPGGSGAPSALQGLFPLWRWGHSCELAVSQLLTVGSPGREGSVLPLFVGSPGREKEGELGLTGHAHSPGQAGEGKPRGSGCNT